MNGIVCEKGVYIQRRMDDFFFVLFFDRRKCFSRLDQLCACTSSHELVSLSAVGVDAIVSCTLDGIVSQESVPSRKGFMTVVAGPSHGLMF